MTTRATEVAPRPAVINIYVFVQAGCDVCTRMKVELETFSERHPSAWVQTLDVTHGERTISCVGPDGKREPFTAEATPTLVLMSAGQILEAVPGLVTAASMSALYVSHGGEKPVPVRK